MTEIDTLKNRIANLRDRVPNGGTEIIVGMRWMLEMGHVLLQLAEYNTKRIET